MRRTTTILLLLCLNLGLWAHTYVDSSVLGEGNFVKLQVPSTGVYSISYDQIKAWGLNPDSVRLLGYGGNLLTQDFTKPHTDDVPSIPFFMYTGTDGKFSSGDYILFYAEGPQGWTWNGSYFNRTQNCYADYGCYFLSDNAGEQRLLTYEEKIEDEDFNHVYTYTALQLHEQDLCNLIDVHHGKEGGGREWYGETMTSAKPKLTIPFTFTDVDTTQTLTCLADAAGSSFDQTTMQMTVCGTSRTAYIQALDISRQEVKASSVSIRLATAQPQSNAIPVTLEYHAATTNDVAYLNFVTAQVPCFMHLRDNQLFIRNTDYAGDYVPSCYHLTGADEYTQIWNMTDPQNATLMPTWWENDTLCWVADNQQVHLFMAVRTNSSKYPAPASRGKVENQNLHAQLRGVQNIIITPEQFRYQAERLKVAHEEDNPSQHWAVVTDEEVFNEFSSGTPDATAFRWMMKYLYDEFQGTDSMPRSLLLFGDGTFDNRKLLKTSGPATLLTYQASNSLSEPNAYATDDYFGWLDDKDCLIGSNWYDYRGRMKIGVGRLPVNTEEEAEDVVNKLITFMQDANPGPWKQQLCFLGDDGNHGLHITTVDAAAEAVRVGAPDFITNKIYLDAYIQETSASGESYPLAYNRFSNMLQTGVSLMDYAGHGSPNNICSENFLTLKQVQGMVNVNQGVWALATCNFARFDQTDQSTAEAAVLNPFGGAIAVVSADRTVYASDNEVINKYFCQRLLEHSDPFTYPNTIGEALRLAKNDNGDKMNKLPYVLLGDPAIRLYYPTRYQAVATQIPDTLHALDLVSISGYISNGDTLSSARRDTVSFNGQLSVTIFDKLQVVKTRDNDEQEESQKRIKTFNDYPNKLFAGTADVVDGKFTFTFRMPKDIRYNIDFGRMTLYAVGQDSQGQAEAVGHCESFKIGGSSPLIIDDNEGPDIQLYLNTPLFRDGDRVNPTPHFYANLYDQNGINTVGSGIGHDLQMVIDNSTKQTYILNDYFTAENNSYQRGTVSYALAELANGSHELSFRAWDLLNNASTQTLHFTVDSDQGPVLKRILVYPNPVSSFGELHFSLENDRPDDRLTMTLTFYNTIGQKLWSDTQLVTDNQVTIPMADVSLPAGIYIYQLKIQTSTQSSSYHNGRLMVY